MIPTKEQRVLWRHEFESRSFTSAIDEYCPSAFGDLLDATDKLEQQKELMLKCLEGTLLFLETAGYSGGSPLVGPMYIRNVIAAIKSEGLTPGAADPEQT